MQIKILVSLLLSFSLTGCVFDENKRIEQSLEKSVIEFHRKLNDERFKEVYEQADEKLKSQIPEDIFVAQLRQIRTQFYPLPDKAYVFVDDEIVDGLKRTIGFKRENFSTFQLIGNEKEVTTEMFEWTVKGNEAKLLSYKIDPVCKKPCGIAIKK
ncbi:MAG: hypothetical protein LH614_22135 [Pyrinomonadaceae bacterium]|nr:hypothetical protein [Pyrinomonadaceae bacterium]